MKSLAALITSALVVLGPLRAGWNRYQAFCANRAEQIRKLNVIYGKLTPNGGTSLDDKINALTAFVTSGFERLEQTNRLVLRLIGKAYWMADPTGAIIDVSPALVNLFQRVPDQLLNWSWVAYLEEAEVSRVIDAWETAVKHEREFQATFNINLPEGDKVRVVMHGLPIKTTLDHDKVLSGYLGWFETGN